MSQKEYDPSKVDVVFGVALLGGWGDDNFCELTKLEESYITHVGADGLVTRIKNLNNLWRCTLTLGQQASQNAVLSAMHLLDLSGNSGPLPFFTRDSLGTTLFASGTAWLVKFPDIVFGKNHAPRQWILDIVDPKVFVGNS
jgi:hypothetical protein